ncbi:hypothetical protein JZ751_015094 [Albula glossodonta]|uniref:Uncharacterized protein n=1 Tax=Albula glossodonta TaxID=121402 RepID=A0A8T2NZP5_9TELE|nr:hypothetical protein JZ751_015094 [Albula glossodonta]
MLEKPVQKIQGTDEWFTWVQGISETDFPDVRLRPYMRERDESPSFLIYPMDRMPAFLPMEPLEQLPHPVSFSDTTALHQAQPVLNQWSGGMHAVLLIEPHSAYSVEQAPGTGETDDGIPRESETQLTKDRSSVPRRDPGTEH